MFCPKCKKTTEHKHMHTPAYPDLPETHLFGTEKYVCAVCEYIMYKEEAESQGLKFVLD